MTEDKSAILFIIFNRVDCAKKVFEAIRKYQPAKLYVAADGPRPGVPDDNRKCEETRALTDAVDWNCEVVKLFRDTNLGVKEAVSGAISWFFDQEEEGIILEDDCLPGESFFYFCDALLARYRYDDRVMHIGGSNLQFGQKRGNASYYFSNMSSIWGWASWRRVWSKYYDKDMTLFEEFEKQQLMKFVFPDSDVATFATYLARNVYEKKINTWDYQLGFSIIINNGLCITPNKNLVANIGFTASGTLTKNPNDIHANIPIEEIHELSHPFFFIPDRQADLYQLSLSMPKKPSPPVKTPFVKKILNKLKAS
jgi:hypothetical protein